MTQPVPPRGRRGAETWAEFYVRGRQAGCAAIADEHPGERVVVVCHGGIIGASFVALGDQRASATSRRVSPTRP